MERFPTRGGSIGLIRRRNDKPTRRWGEANYETEDMVHPVLEERVMEGTREQARRYGWPEERIERQCGKPDA